MNVNDRKLADKKFFQGDTSVLVATESFELGVDNPNPAIKERIDKNNTCDNSEEINKLVGTYQIDGDDAYCFGRDK